MYKWATPLQVRIKSKGTCLAEMMPVSDIVSYMALLAFH